MFLLSVSIAGFALIDISLDFMLIYSFYKTKAKRLKQRLFFMFEQSMQHILEQKPVTCSHSSAHLKMKQLKKRFFVLKLGNIYCLYIQGNQSWHSDLLFHNHLFISNAYVQIKNVILLFPFLWRTLYCRYAIVPVCVYFPYMSYSFTLTLNLIY